MARFPCCFIPSRAGWAGLAVYGFLLSLRLAPVLFLTPLLGVGVVPGAVKSLLVIGLSGLMAGQVSPWIPVPAGMVMVVLQAGSALLSGCLLAYGIQVAFAALSLAGRVMDTQMGFGLAGVLNPLVRQSTALSSWLLTLLAVAYLHATGGQYVLLRFCAATGGFPAGECGASCIAAGSSQTVRAGFRAGRCFGGTRHDRIVFAGCGYGADFSLDAAIQRVSGVDSRKGGGRVVVSCRAAAATGAFFERWFTSILHYWSMWPHD